jgi:hypothetical protein
VPSGEARSPIFNHSGTQVDGIGRRHRSLPKRNQCRQTRSLLKRWESSRFEPSEICSKSMSPQFDIGSKVVVGCPSRYSCGRPAPTNDAALGRQSNLGSRNVPLCKSHPIPSALEIDRRLAAGEPANQIARDYHLNASSLHRHRVNCLGLSSSNAIMKEVARGTAAITCLPSKDELNNAYFELRARIDQDCQPSRTARLARGCDFRA